MSAEAITRPVLRYQPRYIAYAAAHGRTADQMLAHDERDWPGGRMCGYILWISQQWRQWRLDRNHKSDVVGYEHHADFDARLAKKYPACAERQAQPEMEL